MLINAAPRSYTSNIVADADLNLEGYNVTANALYSKDNYLLTMLDYGEAFPTDVKEGDKVFAWGEDSTKSYIYTYKQGAWDAGVKPQHMQDYYIADENRTVKFFILVPVSDKSKSFRSLIYNSDIAKDFVLDGLVFGSDCYILGSVSVIVAPSSYPCDFDYSRVLFRMFRCSTVTEESKVINNITSGETFTLSSELACICNVSSCVNSFNLLSRFTYSFSSNYLYIYLGYRGYSD